VASVLVLAREPPHPPTAGDRVVTHGLLTALARRGHEPHLLAYGREGDGDALRALGKRCASVTTVEPERDDGSATVRKLARALGGRSDVMAMFDAEAFTLATARAIREIEPDVVLAEHPYMGQFRLREVVDEAIADAGARWVTNAHVVEHAAHRRRLERADGWRERLLLRAEIPRLERAETEVYEASDRVLVLGETDRRRLAGIETRVERQRVALDVDAYRPIGTTDEGDEPTLLFFGSYDWFPNEHGVRRFVTEVFPTIRGRVPEARVRLAGRQASPAVERLGEREGVRFLGEVDALAPWVSRASAVVAPVWIGGGVRIKVLEAMAWAAPVLATETAIEGVDARPGEHLLAAEAPEALAEQAVELLTDASLQAELGKRARNAVAERCAIDPVSRELEANLGLA
jgi:glycosyltransferase involved in cell wall biosynthesis